MAREEEEVEKKFTLNRALIIISWMMAEHGEEKMKLVLSFIT